ncbi:MAG: adenylate/guanylate cyclase domain-containing protein [Parvibaculaceae bacterium]
MPVDAPVERKLAAILVADVEGYSRQMHEDEEAALATLTAHRAVVDDLVAQHNGRIIGSAGDSVIADFASGVEAVNCAVAIQRSLYTANLKLAPARRMEFRIGINVGDVMLKNGDLYGDGINVAARIEALAEPGGIYVTRATRDNVRDKVEYNFEDLGERQVKNIPRPVRIFAVAFDRLEPVRVDEAPAEEGAAPAQDKPRDPADVEIEITFWNTVKDSGDAEMFEAYIEKYPDGEFRKLAEIRLARLATTRDPA